MNSYHHINRKYPRVYAKRRESIDDDNENDMEIDLDEREISMSGIMAVGLLAAVFLKGVFWGYALKRRY